METAITRLKKVIGLIKAATPTPAANLPGLEEAIASIRDAFSSRWQSEDLPKIKKFYSRVQEGIPVAVLSVCGRGTREIRFSQYLAYYLDGNRLHGLGTKLMQALAESINFRHDIGSYEVETEKWLGDIEGRNKPVGCICDIVITGKDYVFFIEQKVLSPESNREDTDKTQLQRYDEAIAKNPRFNKTHVKKLYLTPNGTLPNNSGEWEAITHRNIIELVLKIRSDNTLSESAKNNLSTFIMDLATGPYKRQEEDIKEMTELASQLISKGFEFGRATRLKTMFEQMDIAVKLITEG